MSELDRRRFLESFAALGLTSALVEGWPPEEDSDEPKITAEMIRAAENIVDIELSDAERAEIVDGLNESVLAYRDLRAKRMAETVNPCMVFNPLPAGMRLPTERRPFKVSEVQIDRPAKIEDAAFYSVLQLAHLIRTRKVSSTELTRMYLSRLARFDPKLHFVVNLTEELALDQAARADQEIAAGKYRGLLHGVPYGIKDLFSVKSYPTTWGAAPFRDRVIDHDASVVCKLSEAGAVLLAKLSTGTLASGDKWFGGTTRNPWNPAVVSGGSSAGPAAATAAGCVAFSIGTETNGSMVSPCNECGVTGLRPTFGRVSRDGAMPVSWSFDKVTPICRTVEDCAIVLNSILGPDGRDNSIIDAPFNWDPKLDITKLRIGYYAKFFEDELMGDPQTENGKLYRQIIRRESMRVLDFFANAGFELIPLDYTLPQTKDFDMLVPEMAAAFDAFTRGPLDHQVDSHWPPKLRRNRFLPAVEYLQLARFRSIMIEAMDRALQDVDLYIEITWSTNWWTNVTGYPIVVVPCGFINPRRPTTITFVGKLFREAELLAVAKAFQDATDHHLQHPVVSRN